MFCIRILFLVANVVLRKITKAKEAGFPQHKSFTGTHPPKEQTEAGWVRPSPGTVCPLSSLTGAGEKKRLPQAQWEEMSSEGGEIPLDKRGS